MLCWLRFTLTIQWPTSQFTDVEKLLRVWRRTISAIHSRTTLHKPKATLPVTHQSAPWSIFLIMEQLMASSIISEFEVDYKWTTRSNRTKSGVIITMRKAKTGQMMAAPYVNVLLFLIIWIVSARSSMSAQGCTRFERLAQPVKLTPTWICDFIIWYLTLASQTTMTQSITGLKSRSLNVAISSAKRLYTGNYVLCMKCSVISVI